MVLELLFSRKLETKDSYNYFGLEGDFRGSGPVNSTFLASRDV